MSLSLMYSVFINRENVSLKKILNNRKNLPGAYSSMNNSTFPASPTQPIVEENDQYINFCIRGNKGTLENVSYSLFMALLLLASVIGNSLVVISTALSKQLRSRVTVYFIVSLACSDLSFAVSNIPFVISLKIHANQFCHGLLACYWMISSDSLSNIASILNLLLIAIDRFIAITMPFRYTSLLSLRRTKLLIISVWAFSFFWTISGLFQWNPGSNSPNYLSIQHDIYCSNRNYYFYVASFFGVYLLSLVIMSVLYLVILKAAIQQIRVIEASKFRIEDSPATSPQHNQRKSMKDPRVSVNSVLDSSSNREAKKKSGQRKRTRELKATKSVAIVYLAFLICWFPNLVINMIISFDQTYFPTMRKENEPLFLFIFYTLVQIFPILNAMLNPIIYSFSNKHFRKGFIMVLRKLTGRYRSSSEYLVGNRRTTRGISLANNLPNATTSTLESNMMSQSIKHSHTSISSQPEKAIREGVDNKTFDKETHDRKVKN